MPKKITLMDRLRYRFDNFMSRGTIALVAALFAATLCMILTAAAILVFSGLRPEGSTARHLRRVPRPPPRCAAFARSATRTLRLTRGAADTCGRISSLGTSVALLPARLVNRVSNAPKVGNQRSRQSGKGFHRVISGRSVHRMGDPK